MHCMHTDNVVTMHQLRGEIVQPVLHKHELGWAVNVGKADTQGQCLGHRMWKTATTICCTLRTIFTHYFMPTSARCLLPNSRHAARSLRLQRIFPALRERDTILHPYW